MEQATVNVATGALGPVQQKLNALLVQDPRLGDGARSDIEFIKSELSSLHSLLLRIWEREDLGTECNKWMVDAREISYDMEDDIDDYMLDLQPSDGGGQGYYYSISIGSRISRFKRRVMDVSGRCLEEWKTAAAAAEAIKGISPRAGFHHRDASELVGMDEPKKQLIELLQDHEMVCIHGLARMGKTTLADLVYHEIGHEFQCRAFISLSKRRPDMMLEVLRAVLSQVTDGAGSRSTEEATQENLSNQISNFLSDKRYLVIVDDIWHWEEWEIIRRALPEGVPGCRILTTTCANAIAEECRLTKFNNGGACIYRFGGIKYADAATLAKTVFDKKLQSTQQIRLPADDYIFVLKDVLPNTITKMCCGMPLAVECLSSAVATSLIHHDIMAHYSSGENVLGLEKLLWQVLVNGLGSRSINHPSLKPLAESLRLGYDDLPLYLKTCLLYCSMYPTGYLKIERRGLVMKWMAEGFVYDQAQAQDWLDELVSRGLLQQAESSSQDNKQYYGVHPMMRAFLVCKSEQANFAAYLDDDSHESILDFSRRNRRLFVNSVGKRLRGGFTVLMRRGLRARSHVVLSYPRPHPDAGDYPIRWIGLENLRVLSIESTRFPISDIDLADICSRLLRLRYLGLKATAISALPKQIGKMQRLETLDISDTSVSELPQEIQELWYLKTLYLSNTRLSEIPGEIIGKLQHLETLDASNTGVMKLPKEIGKLEHLKTMSVSHTRVRELPREIGELQRLETLDVSHTSVSELPREIGKLRHLRTLNASHTSVRELPREIGKLLLSSSVILFAGSKYPDKARKLSDDDLAVMRHLEEIVIPSSLAGPRPGEDIISIMLYDHSYPLLPVAGLKIVGRHMRVPEWVKEHLSSASTLDIRLCKLEDDDLEFLCNKMPNLQHLTLRLEVLPSKALVITGEGFSRLESFCLDGHRGHMRLPGWAKQHLASVFSLDIRLCQLVDDDLDFLRRKMPYLQHLTLRLVVLPRKAIVITGEGFSMLKSFCLDCRLPVVTFQQGAMPELEHLEFKFYNSRALTSEDPMGIWHLLNLKRVVFQCSPRYNSDAPGISAVINKVRKEAREHRNRITISINGEDEEVVQEKKKKKAAVTSASDRTSDGSNVTSNGGAGHISGASMIEIRPPIPYNDATDDDKGGNIVPVKSYYPFGIAK